MSDPVFQIQADVHARLSADSFFSDVLVLLNEKGLIIDDVDSAVKLFTAKSGKKGAAVVVDRPFREVKAPEASGPEFDVTVPVSVFEMPLINRATGGTTKTIEEICSHVMHVMHGTKLSSNLGQVYIDKDAVTPVVGTEKIIVSEIQLRTRLRFAPPARVTTPTFSGNAAALSIGCNTTAATIYYTTDGSFPWLGNTAATKYGITITSEDGTVIVTENGDPLITPGPFSVSTGTTVRAAAYATNYQASDAASITL